MTERVHSASTIISTYTVCFVADATEKLPASATRATYIINQKIDHHESYQKAVSPFSFSHRLPTGWFPLPEASRGSSPTPRRITSIICRPGTVKEGRRKPPSQTHLHRSRVTRSARMFGFHDLAKSSRFNGRDFSRSPAKPLLNEVCGRQKGVSR